MKGYENSSRLTSGPLQATPDMRPKLDPTSKLTLYTIPDLVIPYGHLRDLIFYLTQDRFFFIIMIVFYYRFSVECASPRKANFIDMTIT